MHSYNYEEKWKALLTPEIVSLLTQIHEFKGAQNLFIEANADSLTELVEIAKIQSTEASNRIEGILTSDERLKKLVRDKTMPKSRNEREIAGYRDVLNTIHEGYDYIPVKPSVILQFHKNLYKFSSIDVGGKYKANDNIIEEKDSAGNSFVRFRPVEAWATADAIDMLCSEYNEAVEKYGADELLLIPLFLLDFLCIHPFNDGNGRMSRLLTLLMLYKVGYIVGKYISIEKLIETTKETYYGALYSSSQGWHDNENDYAPFVEYMLGIVLSAYREFSSRVQLLITKGLSKPERIREIVKNSVGKITKTEIMEKCPDVGQATVQRTLIDLQKKNEITKIGGGRFTAYIWNRENE